MRSENSNLTNISIFYQAIPSYICSFCKIIDELVLLSIAVAKVVTTWSLASLVSIPHGWEAYHNDQVPLMDDTVNGTWKVWLRDACQISGFSRRSAKTKAPDWSSARRDRRLCQRSRNHESESGALMRTPFLVRNLLLTRKLSPIVELSHLLRFMLVLLRFATGRTNFSQSDRANPHSSQQIM